MRLQQLKSNCAHQRLRAYSGVAKGVISTGWVLLIPLKESRRAYLVTVVQLKSMVQRESAWCSVRDGAVHIERLVTSIHLIALHSRCTML